MDGSKASTDYPSGLYTRFGRVTRQTGPGIKSRPLFHGGLALPFSVDYTRGATGVQPLAVIYQIHGRSVSWDDIGIAGRARVRCNRISFRQSDVRVKDEELTRTTTGSASSF